MKLTNAQVLDSAEALKSLSSCKMNAKTAYVIAKSVRKINELVGDIQKVLEKLWDKHGDHTADGKLNIVDGKLTFSEQKRAELYNAEYIELLAVSNDIEGLKPLKLEELTSDIEPSVLVPLDWLITE